MDRRCGIGRPGREGTLFRLPLRSAKVAKNSKIKRGTTAVLPDVAQTEVLDPFIAVASSCMLFLRSVEFVRVACVGGRERTERASVQRMHGRYARGEESAEEEPNGPTEEDDG